MYRREEKELKFLGYIYSNYKTTENGLAYLKVPKEVVREFELETIRAARMVNALQDTAGIINWNFFVEKDEDGILCEFRSSGPKVNDIAASFGGGGHMLAAGATLANWEKVDEIIKAFDGENGVDKFYNEKPDLILLDINLPKKLGWEVCKEIRETSNIPIIMMTARDSDSDEYNGLSIGADDYITKPFIFIELLARIQAIVRRLQKKESSLNNTLEVRDLKLDYLTREVYRGEKKIDLTSKEFALLEYFMRNRNIVLTRTVLKEQIWGIDFISDTNIVDVYVTYLRNKIDRGYDSKFFYTVRGAGYILK